MSAFGSSSESDVNFEIAIAAATATRRKGEIRGMDNNLPRHWAQARSLFRLLGTYFVGKGFSRLQQKLQ